MITLQQAIWTLEVRFNLAEQPNDPGSTERLHLALEKALPVLRAELARQAAAKSGSLDDLIASGDIEFCGPPGEEERWIRAKESGNVTVVVTDKQNGHCEHAVNVTNVDVTCVRVNT